jgi:hypothetical protein
MSPTTNAPDAPAFYRLAERLVLSPSSAITRVLDAGVYPRETLLARISVEQVDALVKLGVLEPLR